MAAPRRLRSLAVVVLVALALSAPASGEAQSRPPRPARPAAPAAPELLLTSGKIFTADSTAPWAEAIAIRGDRIVAVGTSAAVGSLAGPSTRRIDLGGRVVIPGINDANAQIGGYPPRVVIATGREQPPNPPLRLVLDSVAAAARRGPPTATIVVEVGDAVLDDRAARREALDSVAPLAARHVEDAGAGRKREHLHQPAHLVPVLLRREQRLVLAQVLGVEVRRPPLVRCLHGS